MAKTKWFYFRNLKKMPNLLQQRNPVAPVNIVPPGDPLAGLQSLVNNINTIQSNWSANKPASNPWQNLPNARASLQAPLPAQQRPMSMGQMMSQQASSIQAGNADYAAGRAWKLDGGGGQMPTFLPRNPMEQVRDQFNQTHMQGAEASVLSRTPQQRQLGYIDDKGQMTATNRLGMLRRMAATDPNNEQAKNVLIAAEDQATKQMEARRARIPEFQAKAKERNDAKRARAMRQADAMRARMGFGPRTGAKVAPVNPITGGASPKTIEMQAAATNQYAGRTTSPHLLDADMSSGFADLNNRVHARLSSPGASFSDETLKTWQQQSRDAATANWDEGVDPFYIGQGHSDAAAGEAWKELGQMPDNERSRAKWFEEFKAGNPTKVQQRQRAAQQSINWGSGLSPRFGERGL